MQMMSTQSDKAIQDNDNSLQTFSESCSIMYGKITKKQYQYL